MFDVYATLISDYNVLVVGLYRSNLTNVDDFLDLLDALLTKINDDNYDAVIAGDTNIDYSVDSLSCRKFNDVLAAQKFTQHIKSPTRVAGTSATLLDHIFTNMDSDRVNACPVVSNLSDHYGLRASVSGFRKQRMLTHIQRRMITRSRKSDFATALSNFDWASILQTYQDSHILADKIVNIVTAQFHIFFPIKYVPVRKPDSSWITNDILNLKYLLSNIMTTLKRLT